MRIKKKNFSSISYTRIETRVTKSNKVRREKYISIYEKKKEKKKVLHRNNALVVQHMRVRKGRPVIALYIFQWTTYVPTRMIVTRVGS